MIINVLEARSDLTSLSFAVIRSVVREVLIFCRVWLCIRSVLPSGSHFDLLDICDKKFWKHALI